MENKVTFGLCNVHIAKLIQTENQISYGTPFHLPGSVSLIMDKEGATTIFRADNVDYYKKSSNNGYSGSLEVADVIEQFLIEILGQTKDSNGALIENAEDVNSRFAMMGEIEGDVKKRRFVFYDCLAERPSFEHKTTERDDVGVTTKKLDLTISPRPTDKEVKTVLEKSSTNEQVFNNFFNSVYEKDISASV